MATVKQRQEDFIAQQEARVLEEFQSIKKRVAKGATQIHVTALDSVVSVNSFFTVAVFIGLSLNTQSSITPRTSSSISSAPGCFPGEDTIKYLFVFEVVSFSCFLFSSLIAHGMKLYIIFSNSNDTEEATSAEINHKFLRFGIIGSAIGSVAGTIFLLLSMINIIQVRLGNLSCGNAWPQRAAIPLILLVGHGVIIFISSVFYAALH